MLPAIVAITRRIEFDSGHRIPEHKSKCRNIHGHRYVLEASVTGPLRKSGSDTGMVTDFGDLKQMLLDAVGEPWDHAFLCYRGDELMRNVLSIIDASTLGDGWMHKTVLLNCVPTVENLVIEAAMLILPRLPVGVQLMALKLWETPNCYAEWINPVMMQQE